MKLTHSLRAVTAAVLVAGAVSIAVAKTAAAPAESATVPRVVYHVSEEASMRGALNNITNQLASNPNVSITLLANARGVYGLVKGERDRRGLYVDTISGLQAKGVKFVACRTSMRKNNIAQSSLLPGVSTVASGVVELTRLQTQERYAYIKP